MQSICIFSHLTGISIRINSADNYGIICIITQQSMQMCKMMSCDCEPFAEQLQKCVLQITNLHSVCINSQI
jgi:hypothetical protein